MFFSDAGTVTHNHFQVFGMGGLLIAFEDYNVIKGVWEARGWG